VTQENFEPALLVMYMLTAEAATLRRLDKNGCPVCQIMAARPSPGEEYVGPRCIEVAADATFELGVNKGIVPSS
jgi:hypothetical protein